jgi:Domain of unknown function (DUF5666)
MKHLETTRSLVGLLLCAALAACGGGAETKTGSGGTGAPLSVDDIVGSGLLSSLGPEISAGQEFDAANAQIALNTDGGRPIADLRLGMPVEIRGRLTQGARFASAATISAQSAVIGPILSIDLAARRVQLPGVSAQIDHNTIFDSIGTLSLLVPGMSLEVFGLPLPQTGTLLATRVAPGNLAPNQISLLGMVSATGTTSATIAGLTVTNITSNIVSGPIAMSPPPPNVLVANSVVRVTGSYFAATQTIVANQIFNGLTPARPDGAIVVLEGVVESVDANGDFRVAYTSVRGGASATPITAGMRVKARGRLQSGVLLASELSVVAADASADYQVSGPIQAIPDSQSLRVRGERIRITGAIFSGGTSADLVVNRQVRLTVQVENGALVARTIRLL